MLTFLGFDTIIVNNQLYDDQSLCALSSLFTSIGVNKFIYLSPFEFSKNSFSIEFLKINSFKNNLKKISKRGVRSSVFYNLIPERGSVFNPDFKRIYALKKFNSLFIELPMFLDNEYDNLATDINYLLYRHKAFTVVSNFDKILETSSPELCKKLLSVPNLAFALDVNFLFDPKNTDTVKTLLDSNCLILPSITHHISNYVGIINEAEFLMEIIGKRDYYLLCSKIRKCSEKFIV